MLQAFPFVLLQISARYLLGFFNEYKLIVRSLRAINISRDTSYKKHTKWKVGDLKECSL